MGASHALVIGDDMDWCVVIGSITSVLCSLAGVFGLEYGYIGVGFAVTFEMLALVIAAGVGFVLCGAVFDLR